MIHICNHCMSDGCGSPVLVGAERRAQCTCTVCINHLHSCGAVIVLPRVMQLYLRIPLMGNSMEHAPVLKLADHETGRGQEGPRARSPSRM